MKASTDLATILDLACIKATGYPLPSEFHTHDWSYKLVDGKKVAVYKIPQYIMKDPFHSFYPDSFSHKVSRTLINDELMDAFNKITLRKVTLAHFAVIENNIPCKWMGEMECRKVLPKDVVDDLMLIQPHYEQIRSANLERMRELNNGSFKYCQWETDQDPYHEAVKQIRTPKTTTSYDDIVSFNLLLGLVENVINTHGSTRLIEYFYKFLNQGEKSKVEKLIGKVRRTKRKHGHTTTVSSYKPFKLYTHKGEYDYPIPNDYAKSFWQDDSITLKREIRPVMKKDAWYAWWCGFVALQRSTNLNRRLGAEVKYLTDKRPYFWVEICGESRRYVPPNPKEKQYNLFKSQVNSLCSMCGI